MKYRRGFKTEANDYARDMRIELRIPLHGPLCPWKLADHLGYKVVKLSEYAEVEPSAVECLRTIGSQKTFSACTVPIQGGYWIIHNDFHSKARQAADLAHELAHGLLCHLPAPLINASGERTFDPEKELEANWLGPALLISYEAALCIVERGI